MPRKKKGTPSTQINEKPHTKEIDSFAAMSDELNLQESYKSLLLGIAVVLLVGVLVVGYLKNRNSSNIANKPEEHSIPLTKVEQRKNVLGVYTVQAGDDLKSIAIKYYGTPELLIAIVKENGITNPDTIEEGKKLTIPIVDKKQYIAPMMSRPLNKSEITGTSYTVTEYDLLWDIAVRAYGDGIKWKDIAKINNLPSGEAIIPGMILQLPR